MRHDRYAAHIREALNEDLERADAPAIETGVRECPDPLEPAALSVRTQSFFGKTLGHCFRSEPLRSAGRDSGIAGLVLSDAQILHAKASDRGFDLARTHFRQEGQWNVRCRQSWAAACSRRRRSCSACRRIASPGKRSNLNLCVLSLGLQAESRTQVLVDPEIAASAGRAHSPATTLDQQGDDKAAPFRRITASSTCLIPESHARSRQVAEAGPNGRSRSRSDDSAAPAVVPAADHRIPKNALRTTAPEILSPVTSDAGTRPEIIVLASGDSKQAALNGNGDCRR